MQLKGCDDPPLFMDLDHFAEFHQADDLYDELHFDGYASGQIVVLPQGNALMYTQNTSYVPALRAQYLFLMGYT